MIPAQVRYAADIPAGAKLLYGEISSLTDARGYCFASNKYFAELYGVGIRTVQRYLDALKIVSVRHRDTWEGASDDILTDAEKRKHRYESAYPGLNTFFDQAVSYSGGWNEYLPPL